MSWPWSVLGLDGPADLGSVKHAYAQKLKLTHPEEDPEGFQQLHAAYQAARRLCRTGAAPLQDSPEAASAPAAQERGEPDSLESPEVQPEETAGYDYERLFAEGDEERQETQRRQAAARLYRARERRERQAYARLDRALASDEAWSAAFTALCALEALYTARASAQEWNMFLHSSVFLDAQHNLDFVFGLEDFLKERTRLPEEIKRQIFLAYHFYRGRPPAAYLGLYRQLLGSYKRAGQANREIERGLWQARKPYAILAGFLFLIIMTTLFSSYSTSRQTSGSADTAVSASLDTPNSHDRSGEIENAVPLDGGSEGHETSFFSLVISYAAGDYPGPYAVTGRGTAENGGETFQWIQCTGKDSSFEELVMNYYLSADKTTLYCIPESRSGEEVEMTCTHAWRGISVYRCVEE